MGEVVEAATFSVRIVLCNELDGGSCQGLPAFCQFWLSLNRTSLILEPHADSPKLAQEFGFGWAFPAPSSINRISFLQPRFWSSDACFCDEQNPNDHIVDRVTVRRLLRNERTARVSLRLNEQQRWVFRPTPIHQYEASNGRRCQHHHSPSSRIPANQAIDRIEEILRNEHQRQR